MQNTVIRQRSRHASQLDSELLWVYGRSLRIYQTMIRLMDLVDGWWWMVLEISWNLFVNQPNLKISIWCLQVKPWNGSSHQALSGPISCVRGTFEVAQSDSPVPHNPPELAVAVAPYDSHFDPGRKQRFIAPLDAQKPLVFWTFLDDVDVGSLQALSTNKKRRPWAKHQLMRTKDLRRISRNSAHSFTS